VGEYGDVRGPALVPATPRPEARTPGARTPGARTPGAAVPAVLAGAGILAQIAHPLLDGAALRAATVAAVVLLAAAAVTHAAGAWGWHAAATMLATAGGLGLLAEAVGVATGAPFGEYTYADTLGPKLVGVPILVPLAWTMLAYPCLLLGRRLCGNHGTAGVATAGGLALASWDLFLDPQMVADGHWTWRFPEPGLPGVPGVPLTNYAGWILVSAWMIAVLHQALPRDEVPDERVPAAVLAWTWIGSTLGNLAFFGRPWVALWGGLAMGLLVAPYLWQLRHEQEAT
jgi:putative membrane protein